MDGPSISTKHDEDAATMGENQEDVKDNTGAMEGVDVLDNTAEMDAEVEMALAEFDMADDVGGGVDETACDMPTGGDE